VVELSGVLGHELGEIVALLDAHTDLLGPSAQEDAVSGLRRATARLREDYEGLLELTEVASAPSAMSAVDPAEALAAAQQRLRDDDDAPVADVRVNVGPLPAVLADPEQLEQLFRHLLRSATRKAIAAGRSDITIRGSRDGADVRLDIGAAQAPGSAAGRRRAALPAGQGVLLAVSSYIATHNGGRLWVDGNSTSAAMISVTLPAAES
jgi:light-regulated signal transduction histidine kinase (bacteriophytochrome)